MEGEAQRAETREPLRVGLVAAYPAVRLGLRALLAAFPDLQVAADLPSPEMLVEAGPLDVLIVDLDEDEALSNLPQLPLVLLGESPFHLAAMAVRLAQPAAYMLKDANGEELRAAVMAVAQGLTVFDPAVLVVGAASGARVPLDGGENLEPLTERERDVLELLALGLANKEIALRLHISEHTVKFHIGSILSKLGASSRTEAAMLAARRGLLAL